tara:strand:+ start:837 stop:2006 length:1170 start_codon:yes stop_codon:yes gene_type:complete
MSEIKVNSIKGVSATSAAISINNTDGTATANLSNRQGRNLIINGGMTIAQRGTSSSVSNNSYATVDRFRLTHNGADEAPQQAQVDVASGTTPYSLGFRKAFRVTNGNQTSGAGSNYFVRISTMLEGQDIVNSGWNYNSSSSFITLSFWVKSSVAQNFYSFIRSTDGTMYQYPFETGSLTANTWTKVTKTIPGNSNLQFDNNVGGAFELWIHQFSGTDETSSGVALNTWATYDGTAKMPDFPSTWYTTNDATYEITGVQLEVGSVATDFEFEDKNTTLRKCQRYFFKLGLIQNAFIFSGIVAGSQNEARVLGQFPVPMRANPSLTYNNLSFDSEVSGSYESVNAIHAADLNSDFGGRIKFGITTTSASNGAPGHLYPTDAAGYLQGDSEL